MCCLPRPHLMTVFLLPILASEVPLKSLLGSNKSLGLLYRSHHSIEQPKMLLACLKPPAPANLLKGGGRIGPPCLRVASELGLYGVHCSQSQLLFPGASGSGYPVLGKPEGASTDIFVYVFNERTAFRGKQLPRWHKPLRGRENHPRAFLHRNWVSPDVQATASLPVWMLHAKVSLCPHSSLKPSTLSTLLHSLSLPPPHPFHMPSMSLYLSSIPLLHVCRCSPILPPCMWRS